MPSTLATAVELEGRQAWAEALPDMIDDLRARWSLEVGPPFEPGGHTAWVAPARAASGLDAVIKVAWRHPEASQEAAGLQVWAGHGAVQVYATRDYPDTVALLLERCSPGTPLSTVPEHEQDRVIAGVLRRLWSVPPPDDFPTLQAMCDAWAASFEADLPSSSIEPELIARGIALLRELPRTASRSVLLCTDLHAGNVLAAQREPWLLIDPKPHVGDPTFDAVQHMLNCPHRLNRDPHGLLRRLAQLLGLDPERLQLWLFARCVQESPQWPVLDEVARAIAPG